MFRPSAANQVAGHSLGFINSRLYALAQQPNNGIVDVTQGNNSYVFCSANCGTPQEVDTTVPGYAAAPGYDLASGLGTVNAPQFVRRLAG